MSYKSIKLGDKNIAKIGDIVSFKSDVEQYGKLVVIRGEKVVLESVQAEGFEGDYIGGEYYYTTSADSCWKE